ENNFKQMGIAVHIYASTNQDVIPPAILTSKDGRPLFSWRVAILPYVEQGALYQRLKLDEPWNSPNNKRVLDSVPMPKVFEIADAPAPPNMTYIQVFTGRGTVFEQPGKAKYNIGNFP